MEIHDETYYENFNSYHLYAFDIFSQETFNTINFFFQLKSFLILKRDFYLNHCKDLKLFRQI